MGRNRFLLVVAACLLLAPAHGRAETKARRLSERIRAVTKKLYGKGGRLELTIYPMTSISLNDAFYQKLGGGLGLAYHFSDQFSAQLTATYSLNLEAGHATTFKISPNQDSNIPYAGKRSFLGGADFCWAPVYGKVSIASEAVIHFDTYLLGGFGLVTGEQVEGTSFGFGLNVGLGFHVFLSRLVALKAELKDFMIFTDKVSFGEIERSDVQHQLLFNLGLSLFFLEGNRED
ncbi:MAG: outer membrane beta-barrel domain-containing protein [Deltaproteobacteria bacterium]|nr:MAG: outer membrane beta-barrel domain-containing protein [Deltaproteobacteria bacterium]